MGLLDSLLGAASGKDNAPGGVVPLIGVLGGLLAQSGGLQGLANRFSQSGQGDVFSSWVGMGQNETISPNQIQNVIGSDQLNALAAKMGIDPAVSSTVFVTTFTDVGGSLSFLGLATILLKLWA